MNKIDKFYEIKNLLKCPRCGKKMRFHAGGLVCKKEHRFDISSKGYVNLLQENKAMKGYDRAFFENRSRFLDAGYYNHVIEAVGEAVKERVVRPAEGEPAVIMDAGCGEGSYAANLCNLLEQAGIAAEVLAFDISADAVKTAARNSAPVKWMVADITNIPMKDSTADCVLDIFTPANYGEFQRILKPGGILVKVVPGTEHMGQLRKAAAPFLRSKEYSNEEVLDYFEQHFQLLDRRLISRTMEIKPEHLSQLIAMTPLLFDVDKDKLDLSSIREITVEAALLIGKAK